MEYITLRKEYGTDGFIRRRDSMNDFNATAINRWTRSGLLLKARNGLYALPDRTGEFGYIMKAANLIYEPSYISLQYALSFYDMIPESVVSVTSITTKKTAEFHSAKLGDFYYRNIKTNNFNGFVLMGEQHKYQMATPEKAIADLLYLNHGYNSEEDMKELRLDDEFMKHEFNWTSFESITSSMESRTLQKRTQALKNVYR